MIRIAQINFDREVEIEWSEDARRPKTQCVATARSNSLEPFVERCSDGVTNHARDIPFIEHHVDQDRESLSSAAWRSAWSTRPAFQLVHNAHQKPHRAP